MPVVSINGAEALLERHFRDHLPQYLGQAVVMDGQLRSIASQLVPRDWGRIDDWPTGLIADPLPAFFIISEGRTGEYVNDAEAGFRIDVLTVKIALLMTGTGEGDRYQSSGMGTRLYDTALLQLALDRPHVLVDGVRIVDVGPSKYQAMSQDSGSTVGLLVADLLVAVATASLTPLFFGDPTGTPDVPDVPVDIEIVDVTVEAA